MDATQSTSGLVDDTRIVLVDSDGTIIGAAPKEQIHTAQTPLHLAFSCYLFADDGRLLLTRRALTKRSWPGVWTNSFCGHPAPGETVTDSIHRHADTELGASIAELTPVLPDFRYEATDAARVVEREICPVYRARLRGGIDPAADEIIEYRWVTLPEIAAVASNAPYLLSPWMVLQLAQWPDLAKAG